MVTITTYYTGHTGRHEGFVFHSYHFERSQIIRGLYIIIINWTTNYCIGNHNHNCDIIILCHREETKTTQDMIEEKHIYVYRNMTKGHRYGIYISLIPIKRKWNGLCLFYYTAVTSMCVTMIYIPASIKEWTPLLSVVWVLCIYSMSWKW